MAIYTITDSTHAYVFDNLYINMGATYLPAVSFDLKKITSMSALMWFIERSDIPIFSLSHTYQKCLGSVHALNKKYYLITTN